MAIDFWIVDTFSETPLNGGPSAVVFMDDFSNEELMQNIAMELNVPETGFLRKFNDQDFEISCFCPTSKGIFLGNSLFASAHILHSEKILKEPTFNFILGTRIFETTLLNNKEIKIRFSTPTIAKTPMPDIVTRALQGESIVSIGESKNALIVEVRSPKKLASLTPNTDLLRHLAQDLVIITADTHYENETDYDFCTRVFAPKFGIMEDKVTPLAHSRLASYWKERINKNEMIGFQASKNGGFVKISWTKEFTYLSAHCISITKGVLFL